MAASDYRRGEMETAEQARTFDGFMRVTVWSSLLVVAGVLFLTLVFAVGAHWLIGLVAAAFVAVLGGIAVGRGTAYYAVVVGLVVLGLIGGGIATFLATLAP